ncbi:regulatory protein fmdB [Methylophaga lonarensis MPL]|uniref:Regulatory protein fmdB n=1 Tax=Methylophaga lonarensis MPL TaxID=1286106 RepID=M7NXK3_9GAMM|nr:zinc ribbon domain-containing protein [Methylophaga lonarensis]EMR13518.1 regulatory protein fmdB [Methylophaga lonarensis MPL]
MPLYDYRCEQCGTFTALRKMHQAGDDITCDCGLPARRVVTAPHLALMDGATRIAMARNEKSADSPRLARRSSCGCTGAHTCKTDSSASSKHQEGNSTGLKMQTKKTARPWMLGH